MTGRRRKSAADRRPLPPGSGPIRTCVGCGQRDRSGRLLRIQGTDSGSLRIAKAGAGGRGAYLHPAEPCVEALATAKLLRRSLRSDIGPDARGEIAAMILNERLADARDPQRATD